MGAQKSRREFLRLALAGGAATVILSLDSFKNIGRPMEKAEKATAGKPNIVIILADDMGWADMGYHGAKISTPNIDRLAKDGVRLENFHVCPLCSPTRAGLLTGRWPIRYGMGDSRSLGVDKKRS